MVSRAAYPPTYHHASKRVSPRTAHEQLSAFLSSTSTNAYLHPDAILSSNGIQYPAHSGPQGGLALHHLRRIEAGIRGENLVAESREELQALFADDANLPSGDDDQLDAVIAESERRGAKRARSVERVMAWNGEGDEDEITASGALDGADMMDPNKYAEAQEEINKEMGNEELADSGKQVSAPPKVKTSKRKLAAHEPLQEFSGPVDKGARKAAKKERRLQEKKAKQERRREASDD